MLFLRAWIRVRSSIVAGGIHVRVRGKATPSFNIAGGTGDLRAGQGEKKLNFSLGNGWEIR